MVKVRLYYCRGRLGGLVVEGHAEAGSYGNDIVCAAISALAQTAVLALERVAGVKARVRVRPGHLECFLPGGLAPEVAQRAAVVLETAAVGLAAVAQAHPRHVVLHRRSVAVPEVKPARGDLSPGEVD